MVTLLDCIERIPSVMENILAIQDEAFAAFMEYIKDRIQEIDEIIFVGSGTSNTVAMTSQAFVEKVSGIRTKVVLPNDYVNGERVYNPRGLYVFTSQTGTSKEVCKLMDELEEKGFLCVAMTEGADTMLAKAAPCHICLNCGKEEYLMRTIGYTTSVLNHMLMGLRLGLARGYITKEQYLTYQKEAGCVPDSHRTITEQTKKWFQKNKRQIMRSDCVIFTGAGDLYGVALEGAVKFWEMPQVISIGYELEEGLHGPNYGYNENHCVVVFNDGKGQSEKALSLARYMKEVFGNGLVVGAEIVDDKDLKLDLKGGSFACLEFSAVPQVMAYFLAEDGGRDLTIPSDHTVMYSYFNTHA